ALFHTRSPEWENTVGATGRSPLLLFIFMLILVSNDDGVYSKGIKVLAHELKKIAQVLVVAPDREKTAASHSLTLHRPLRVTRVSPKVYAVDGTPTDCITLGIYEI